MRKISKTKEKTSDLEVVDAETWEFIKSFIQKGIQYHQQRDSAIK